MLQYYDTKRIGLNSDKKRAVERIIGGEQERKIERKKEKKIVRA
jgi:hypothetical protein